MQEEDESSRPGLTENDRERMATFLKKPVWERSERDLMPE